VSAHAIEKFPARVYVSPSCTKLTPSQANLLLMGYALDGHAGAQELLTTLYPEINPQFFPPAPRHSGARKPAGPVGRLLRRAQGRFRRWADNYHRWLRG
jgi:hypothetical protein